VSGLSDWQAASHSVWHEKNSRHTTSTLFFHFSACGKSA